MTTYSHDLCIIWCALPTFKFRSVRYNMRRILKRASGCSIHIQNIRQVRLIISAERRGQGVGDV